MPPAAETAVDAAAVARNRRRDRGMRMVMETLQLPEKRRRWRRNLTERGRLYDKFVTVDKGHAPVGLSLTDRPPKIPLSRLLHLQCATEFRASDFRRCVPEYRRQSTGQRLVPEFEAAGLGLIRQHALSSQQ